ncbi:MAG: glycosyltransferase family 2 protein [Lachnospiraceae bacterium]|nr:glycosyltransferase family 2 protein [Lachnospiraceae bacterium]
MTITVFTPTYNRAKLLERSYQAMRRQTNQNFVWLIVDDGSSDNTKDIVEIWANEKHDFQLKYVYKENGGLQSGYVEALKHIETDLCFCVDSDDYLLDDAIERISKFWDEHGSEKYAGILALDQFSDGNILGGMFPGLKSGDEIDLLDIDIRKRIVRPMADRMLVIRTEVYKTAKSAKCYPGERTINATYLHLQIAQRWKFILLNEPICVVEYQTGGRSDFSHRLKDYCRVPNTYADWRLFKLGFKDLPFKEKCIQNIHYIAECILARRRIIKDSPTKALTVVLFPAGTFLYLYLKKYK